MALPVFRANSAKAAGTGAVTPALPTGVVADDIVILVATTIAGGSISITANGSIATWTAVTGSPIDVASGEKLYVWWGRYSSGSTGPTVTPGGNHCCAATAAWSGCITTGDPVNNQATGTETTSDTSLSFATGISTSVNDCMVLLASSSGVDSNTAQHSAQANANLSGVVERADYQTNSGGGGGFELVEGGLATAGAIGTWTATLATASPKAYISFALKPPAGISYQTLDATEISVISLVSLSLYLRILSVIETSVVSLSRLISYFRTLSVTEIGITTLSKLLSTTLSVIETSIAMLDKVKIFLQTLSVIELSVPSLSRIITFIKTISATEISIPSLTIFSSYFRSLSVSEVSVSTLSRLLSYYRSLSITEISVPTIAAANIFFKIISTSTITIVSLTKNIFLNLSMSAISVGIAIINALENIIGIVKKRKKYLYFYDDDDDKERIKNKVLSAIKKLKNKGNIDLLNKI